MLARYRASFCLFGVLSFGGAEFFSHLPVLLSLEEEASKRTSVT